MDRYNLIDEPWITCAMRDGTKESFGLRSVLEQSHLIAAIAEQSPLVTFGIYRLLLAIVHWLTPITSVEQWQQQWQEGRFSVKVIDALADQGANCFDLFHPEKPFYQDVGLQAEHKAVSYLIPEIPTKTNVNHFHHAYDESQHLCPACCAKGLIALPPFCTAGGSGLSPSINGIPVYYVLPVGRSFFETLMLNLPLPKLFPQYDKYCPPDDQPAWGEAQSTSSSVGFLEGITWQPRRVLLLKESNGTSGFCTGCGKQKNRLVQRMIFAKGRSPKETEDRAWSDLHVPLKGERSLPPSERPDFWRTQLRALLANEQDVPFQPPPSWRQVRKLAENGLLSQPYLNTIHFMFRAKQAAPTWYCAESILVPMVMVSEAQQTANVLSVLDQIDKVARNLFKQGAIALRQFEGDARTLLTDALLTGNHGSSALEQSLLDFSVQLKFISFRCVELLRTSRSTKDRWRLPGMKGACKRSLDRILARGGEKHE